MNEHEKHQVIGEAIIGFLLFGLLALVLAVCAVFGGLIFGFWNVVLFGVIVGAVIYMHKKEKEKK